MDRKGMRYRGRGFVPLELLAVICIIAILLGLGVVVVQNAREQAHLAQAEGNLRQVSIALDLYYKKYNAFPPAGCNLAEALAEFVQNPKVFENVLMPETEAGYTLSRMYAEPTSGSFDEAENVLTALLSSDGNTIVVLKTFGKVECRTGLSYDPHSLIGSSMAAGYRVLKVLEDGISKTTYVVEKEDGEDAVTVKFEAGDDQLGDEDALAAHVFRIPVDRPYPEAVAPLTVILKAGTDASKATFGADEAGHYDGDPPEEIVLDGKPVGDYYVKYAIDESDIVITIVSDSVDAGKTAGLSHLIVEIGGDAHITLADVDPTVDTIKLEF
jgi:type II secretory pathway pseudopilin PulG